MELPSSLSIFAVDVGRPKKLGWARRCGANRSVGQDAQHLADAMAHDARARLSIALGFECPLFLPIAKEPLNLLSARCGEHDRSWSASAGASATTAGIVTLSWVFRRFAESVGTVPSLFSDWDCFSQSRELYKVFVWEAFVSKRLKKLKDVLGIPPEEAKWKTKEGMHINFDKADALTAVDAFQDSFGQPTDVHVKPGCSVFSIVHAVVASLGWDTTGVPTDMPSLVRKRTKPDWNVVPRMLSEVGDQAECNVREWFVAQPASSNRSKGHTGPTKATN